jgi:histidinol-phosphatase (PHP family)
MIDYHLHTLFCNHAVGSMEQYIQSAVDSGIEEICFLDHLTVRENEKGLSMTPAEIPYYFQAVQVLKQRYRRSIRIKTGLEIDFNPDYSSLFEEIIGTFSFDVIASSLHFPDDMDIVSHGSAWRHGKEDTDSVYALYFEAFQKMLDYSYFDMVCHMDLVKKFGRKPSRSFGGVLNEILHKIKNKNIVVEVNTSGYNHPAEEIYPAPDILNKCNELGIGITLGSDAHHPADVGRHFERALPVILSAGYSQLSVFTRRERSEIAIRE